MQQLFRSMHYLNTLQFQKNLKMYADKLQNYQSTIKCVTGRFQDFHQYMIEFAKEAQGDGVDVGAGPKGVYANYFEKCSSIDGCDAQEGVVGTFPAKYSKKFVYILGGEEPLPYADESKDFAICSCVIQHLPNEEKLILGLKEIARILKKGGKFALMYKAGTHDTQITHYNTHYKYNRTFRVFNPKNVKKILEDIGMEVQREELFLDGYFLPYSFFIIKKK